MDPVRFDRLTKSLSTSGTRRGALGGLLAGTLGLLGLSESAAKKRRNQHHADHRDDAKASDKKRHRATAEGSCGDGGGRANSCEKDNDCCTRFCQRGRCRCKKLGQGCTQDRNCCAQSGQPMACQSGSCQSVPAPAGCTPTTCAALGTTCGRIADGCGGTLNCRPCTCATGCHPVCQTCNPATGLCDPNPDGTRCGDTCSEACTNGSCGPRDPIVCARGQRCRASSCICDGISCSTGCCAGLTCLIDDDTACGTGGRACTNCTSLGQLCGGSGTPGVCGCATDATTCVGKCGMVQNNCGQPINCTALCAGCCAGATCQGGTSRRACGAGGASSTSCANVEVCRNNVCTTACTAGANYCTSHFGGCGDVVDETCSCVTTYAGTALCAKGAVVETACTDTTGCSSGQVCILTPTCGVGTGCITTC